MGRWGVGRLGRYDACNQGVLRHARVHDEN